MTITTLFQHTYPYVKPYRRLLIATLLLTAVGSVAAQVNAWVLRYTVDELNALTLANKTMRDGARLLWTISGILIGKELLHSAIQFGQKYYGEKPARAQAVPGVALPGAVPHCAAGLL